MCRDLGARERGSRKHVYEEAAKQIPEMKAEKREESRSFFVYYP